MFFRPSFRQIVSTPSITVSVVSHRQSALVNSLLNDLARYCVGRIALVVTINTDDPVELQTALWPGPLEVLINAQPKGFAANHNAAFELCRTPYFCVCNPDIRLVEDPFPTLVDALAASDAGVVGPLVRNPAGAVEDSARRFPTLYRLLRKALATLRGPDYEVTSRPMDVDWVAGMFMLFVSSAFRAVGGFDEGYFLYYEDVDACRELHRAGKRVLYDPRVAVVHEARRQSHRDPALARHHIASAWRFLRGPERMQRLARDFAAPAQSGATRRP